MTTAADLISAAEQLIADEGVNVSIRAINVRAGANAAAAHYHFGSKERLVRAVLESRMATLASARERDLEPLLQLEQPPLGDIATAVVMPLARLALDERSPYVRFLAALRRGGGPWAAMIQETFADQAAVLDALLGRALRDLPEHVRAYRRAAVGILIMELLGHQPQTPQWSTEATANALVDIVVHVLGAPPTTSVP